MRDEIKIFENSEFGQVRVILDDSGEPLFCLKDLCGTLGINKTNEVVNRIDKGCVTTAPLQTAGGTQQTRFVNEDGLYDVILESRKPEARRFRKWVTSEVLPSIRKTGAYGVRQLSPAELLLKQAELMVQHERRLTDIERRLDRIDKMEAEVFDLPDGNTPPEMSMRAMLNSRIRQYANKKGVTYKTVWRKLYNDYKYRCHKDLALCAKNRGMSIIDYAEQCDYLGDLYDIASSWY